jgi:hypothetical protein
MAHSIAKFAVMGALIAAMIASDSGECVAHRMEVDPRLRRLRIS